MNSLAKPDIKDKSRVELEEWLVERREAAYRAAQIHRWLFQRGALDFARMSDVPADLRRAIERDFAIGKATILARSTSSDGTVKFLFGLGDTAVESVLIPEAKRLTLCVSTQAGCGLGCAFCATAKMGLKRNLRAGEVIEQILAAQRTLAAGQRITHVVLMGMGEPLANYKETLRALEVITDADCGIGISPRRVTLSTVGLVPQIERLMAESRVNLAISLHATTEEARSELMPINRKYSLAELLRCCRSLPLPRRRRITFEYVLLGGVNDSPEDAKRLARLLRELRCKINLIPYNPGPEAPFQRPDAADVTRFQEALQRHGYQVNVRRPRGDDIQAACGQLYAAERGRSLPGEPRADRSATLEM
jgi:23S rRNA (adenine2503-C2)-methyltransferase